MNFLLQPITATISVGGVALNAHSVFFTLGALTAFLYMVRLKQRYSLELHQLAELFALTFFAGIIGARLLYVILYDGSWSLTSMLAFWDGGLVSFGGVVAGGITFFALAKKIVASKELVNFLRDAAIAVLFGWAVGRLGNYYTQESVGVLSESWQITYGRVPIQLFESFAYVVLGFYAHFALKKPAGQVLLLLGIGFFGVRFVVDFWRDEVIILGLRLSQFVPLIVLPVLLIMLIRITVKERHEHGI